MKILQINATYKIGSTGHIMSDLSETIISNGDESYMLCAYSNEKAKNIYQMSCLSYPNNARINILRMLLTGINGYCNRRKTVKALKWINSIEPDVIHLHNIHGDWINLKLLFDFIIKRNIPIVWTLHDCWAFTGRCSHFELCGCQKWREGCSKCNNRAVYPTTWALDFSKKMYWDKKRWFCGVKNMTIVTPSKWLAEYVKQSFLGSYPRKVINNGIDTTVYRPMPLVKQSKNCTIKIILGVASSWSNTKGLDDFIKLDKLIDHSKYKIMLVGLNKRQLLEIPDTIEGIERTNSVHELVEIYNRADVFLNLTYQDNFPTVNMEAISCGIPVITYKTGGSPESVDVSTGYVVKQGDLQEVLETIEKIDKENNFVNLVDKSNRFDKNNCFNNYIKLYYSLTEGEE